MPTFAFDILEVPEKIEEELNLSSGVRAKRTFVVPWANRFDFAIGMLSGGGALGTEPRIYNTGFDNVKVASAKITPVAMKNASNFTLTNPEAQIVSNINQAFVELSYQTQLFDVARQESPNDDGSWFTYDGEHRPEYMTLPGRALKWESDDAEAPPDVEASLLICLKRHRIVWHNVLAPDWDLIDEMCGKVNQYAWTLPALGIDAPAETVLFEGFTPSTMSTGLGDAVWQLTFDFLERRISNLGATGLGWNHTYRETVGWDRLVDKDSGERQYQFADFDDLYVQLP